MAQFFDFPHPRVLFESVPDDVYVLLEKHVAHAVRIGPNDLVHEDEFDLYVTFEEHPQRLFSRLSAFSVGAESLSWKFSRDVETYASELYIPDPINENDDARQLVEDTLVDLFPPGQKLAWRSDYLKTGTLDDKCIPLLHLGDAKEVLALIATDFGGGSYVLALPPGVGQIERWFTWFISVLHNVASDRFPAAPGWAEAAEWSSAAAVAAADTLEQVRAAWAEAQVEFVKSEREALDRLEALREEDKRGLQRLLTEDGHELEEAVARAFDLLGFEVTVMGEDHRDPVTKALLEDIRVQAPGEEWTALVEVKGYTKGAKVGDLSQITNRPVLAFHREHDREPDALWHVVNAHRRIDPSARPRAINSDAELDGLAAQHGMLIDTRELFRAVRAVQDRTCTPGAVRESLRAGLRRWTFDPPNVEGPASH